MKPTPGPWRVVWNGCNYDIRTQQDDCFSSFASVSSCAFLNNTWIDYATQKANAQLMAAAPDLLTELEKLCAVCWWDLLEEDVCRDCLARKAIAKAKGDPWDATKE